MIRRERLWLVAALVVAVALAAPAAPANAADGGWPGRIWSWLAAVLPWQPPVQTACDWGSSIDPDGRCRSGVAPDWGPMIDPDG